jgi:hypothetical protein
LPSWATIAYLINMNIERFASLKTSMGYQNEFGLDPSLSKIIGWIWELAFFSPIIVSVMLIFIYVESRKKYQWSLGFSLMYTIFGGVMGFIAAIAVTVKVTMDNPSPQMPLVILGFGPPLIAIGELAGFALFTRLEARKRRGAQGEV